MPNEKCNTSLHCVTLNGNEDALKTMSKKVPGNELNDVLPVENSSNRKVIDKMKSGD